MPTQLSEGMTGSRTESGPARRICAITGLEKAHNHTIRRLPLRHPTTGCIGPAQRQDRSSSLRCGRSVLTPGHTRRCLHGSRKPAKPLVNNGLTEPRPFRDDELTDLEPQARHQLVTTLRQVSETLAEVPDGKTTSRVLGVLAHLLDSA